MPTGTSGHRTHADPGTRARVADQARRVRARLVQLRPVSPWLAIPLAIVFFITIAIAAIITIAIAIVAVPIAIIFVAATRAIRLATNRQSTRIPDAGRKNVVVRRPPGQ